jgi:hypothetical protein
MNPDTDVSRSVLHDQHPDRNLLTTPFGHHLPTCLALLASSRAHWSTLKPMDWRPRWSIKARWQP